MAALQGDRRRSILLSVAIIECESGLEEEHHESPVYAVGDLFRHVSTVSALSAAPLALEAPLLVASIMPSAEQTICFKD